MKQCFTVLFSSILVVMVSGCVALAPTMSQPPIEPEAANWGTWVLATNDELRPAAPPDAEATAAELEQLREAVESIDAEAEALIIHWNAGAPNYRWNEIAMDQFRGGPPSNRASRGFALLNAAIYDAVIATWDAKFTYNRQAPSGVDAFIDTPAIPSYPSEHAAAAGAASAILGYLFPDNAEFFAAQAVDAAQSRVMAGINYPSDVEVGLALGQAVAEKVIERAGADGFKSQWTGEIPTGPGLWKGDNPVTPLGGTWQPWTLISGDQFRAPAPPAHDSEEVQAQIAEMKAMERTPEMLLESYFRRTIGGSYFYWLELTGKLIAEQHLDENPPQAALIYSALSISGFDSSIACFDSKYAYWYIRPSQLDSELVPLFGVPRHPSYPAAHSCATFSSATILSEFFTANESKMIEAAHKAGQSRVWANVHYPMDIDAGEAIGGSVAETVLEHVQTMLGN